jgi:hypothetical protein
MSEQDPKRLLEGGGSAGSGDLRSLLEAGRSEVPDNARLAMLAVKMGIVGGLGGAGAAGAAGAGGAGAGGGAAGGAGGALGGGKAVATAATAVKVGMGVKVIGVIAVATAAGAGAVVVANRQAEAPPKPAGMVAMPSSNAGANAGASANANANANANASADVFADLDAGVAPIATKPATATATAGTRGGAANTASADAKDEGPEAEVKLVQRAQDALRGARPAEALALCNDHAKRFPNGMVTQECEVIAVEALVKTGRKDEARKRADRFKARFPGSASIRRLDVLLGD